MEVSVISELGVELVSGIAHMEEVVQTRASTESSAMWTTKETKWSFCRRGFSGEGVSYSGIYKVCVVGEELIFAMS